MTVPAPSPRAWPYAEVAVDLPRGFRPAPAPGSPPIDTFHYAIPPALRGRVESGQRVWAPFGRRRCEGIVVALRLHSPVAQTRALLGVVDREPVLGPAEIALARWVSTHYLAPFYACLRLLLPPGGASREVATFARTRLPWTSDVLRAVGADAQAVLGAFGRARRLTREQIGKRMAEGSHLTAAAVDAALAALEAAGLVTAATSVVAPGGAQRDEAWLERVAGPGDSPDASGDSEGSDDRGPDDRFVAAIDPKSRTRVAQAAVLAHLDAAGGAARMRDAQAATGASRRAVDALAAAGLVRVERRTVWRDPLAGVAIARTSAPPFTADQAAAWAGIERLLGRGAWAGDPRVSHPARPKVCLVYGITGSGKTELYLRSIAHVLAQGRQALVLVPEIALAAQQIRRFAGRFPGRVGVWHSELSAGERADTWRRVRQGLLDVVVGSRSAVFAPMSRLGLIVLDEEHADAYKQPNSPRYHARDVAIHRAALTGATVLLGSATPSVESYWQAERGAYARVALPSRVVGELPPVRIVDMRAELRAGNTSIFSAALESALGRVLAAGEQAMLYLNRRGSASFVLCRDCGHVESCPHCRLPLTWHRAGEALVCHHCNHRRMPPMLCPACASARIRFFGAGVEKVQALVRERFGGARVIRWDADTTGAKGAHDAILTAFADGRADVLVGTQMIAKGLDLPRVTLVGIVSADVGLYFPDPRAHERAFQILSQVAGRAGRSSLGGEVILQTYAPDHPAIVAAAQHDYAAFYPRELAFRAENRYPPFGRLVRLLVVAAGDGRAAEAAATAVAEQLRAAIDALGLAETDIIGPAPAFFQRERGKARWQIVVRSPRPHELLARMTLGPGWRVDVDPVDLL